MVNTHENKGGREMVGGFCVLYLTGIRDRGREDITLVCLKGRGNDRVRYCTGRHVTRTVAKGGSRSLIRTE